MNPVAQSFKTALRHLENRLRFSKASIGRDTFVERGSRIAGGTKIGAGCAIFKSEIGDATQLGDKVILAHGSRVSGTTLGAGCSLDAATAVHHSMLADHVTVQTGCELTDVRIGRCSYVGRETYLNDVSAGSFCSIGPRTLMGFGNHPVNFPSTAPAFYSTRKQCGMTFAPRDSFVERACITLGSDVWIGAHVFVCDGVHIGDGAIVAAGSVVTKDVPPYAIVGGVPARVIRLRFPEKTVAAIHALRWWSWSDEELREAQPLMGGDDVEAFLDWAAHRPSASAQESPLEEKTASSL